MSYLAIGAVTRAIAELLTRKLNNPPLMTGNFRVTTLPPDDERVNEAQGVNLFLYRINESPFAKNVDWRGDRVNPVSIKYPPLALTLQYLLTAYVPQADGTGQDDITAHQILGNAMAVLHEHPVLNDIHDSDFDADVDTQFAPELRNSFEKIEISMLPISMDEFSKIWTGLSKAYRLSVAYEVSLVQVAPIVPAPVPGPPVQQTGLRVIAIGAPTITSVEPPVGSVNTTITLKGSGFKNTGMSTCVSIGDTILTEEDLERVTSREIVLSVPEALQKGPELPIIVSAGGRDSEPAFYEVHPWIDRIQPLRGITGIPLTITSEIPSGIPIRVEIGGETATGISTDPNNKLIRALVPTTITTNGPKAVVVIQEDTPPKRSNSRFYEVLPLIQSVNITSTPSPVSTTIAVTGERLNGTDVHIKYGGILLRKGENTPSDNVTLTVQRTLPSNQPISVIVEGRESNTLPSILERIEPAQSHTGASVKLTGRSLSGHNVIVNFGSINVPLGPHPYGSEINVTVPSTLIPGEVDVSITVDGNNTNTLSFEVVP